MEEGIVSRLLCWLGYHQTSPSELSYNFATREISLHCKNCQRVIDKVEHETKLSDEQYYWFKRIFEDGDIIQDDSEVLK